MNRWKISAEMETPRKSQMKMLEVKKKKKKDKHTHKNGICDEELF